MIQLPRWAIFAGLVCLVVAPAVAADMPASWRPTARPVTSAFIIAPSGRVGTKVTRWPNGTVTRQPHYLDVAEHAAATWRPIRR